MQNIAEIVKTPSLVTAPSKPEEPKGVRITLWVCSCYNAQQFILRANKAERVAKILDITIKDLAYAIALAMFTGKPEVVGCYKQRDLAEQKLDQLVAETPFIIRSCHSFDLVVDS